MEIKIVKNFISRKELTDIAEGGFGDFVKAVVDTEQEIMAVGGELHADEEVLLSETCASKRQNLWGVNLYPKIMSGEWIEFDSMVNIKPALHNRGRGIENAETRKKIEEVVKKLVVA